MPVPPSKPEDGGKKLHQSKSYGDIMYEATEPACQNQLSYSLVGMHATRCSRQLRSRFGILCVCC